MLVMSLVPAAFLAAHPDDPKLKDRQLAIKADAYRSDINHGSARSLGFESENVQLKSWLPLNELGSPANGNDCWGYVSPSGREYALMGTSSGTVIVEITNPGNPQIIASLSGPNSLWRDIKTYGTYMYVVSEGGGGIQVFNLANIDLGQVQTLNSAGSGSTHNVAVDTDSGFLYRTGGVASGLYFYSLANPAVPTQVGQWTDRYVHDAQIVTYTEGPFAGRQIAFCCAGFSGGWSDTGLTIVDVTNKSNPFVVSQTYYSNAAYSHQGWLSEDRKYFYLNDELDEQDFGGTTTTRIINVEDIENPSFVGTFTSGSSSIDHNLYTHNGMIFEANYRSGLRVFDASNPTSPVQYGYFDTYPNNDGASFNGLWSVYPYFPSGTVIGSDLERGLFVWEIGNYKPVLVLEYPNGHPDLIDPNGDTRVAINVQSGTSDPSDNGGLLHWNVGSGWQQSELISASTSDYEAVFPAFDCGASVDWFISFASVDGNVVLSPEDAPSDTWNGAAYSGTEVTFDDDFQSDQGWSVDASAGTGNWERGVPSTGGVRCDAPTDADGSGMCYVTGNSTDEDVDDGTTTLYSPVMDASEAPVLSYSRWYNNGAPCNGADPQNDYFYVDISDDGGASWMNLETVGPINESSGGWYFVEHDLSSVSGFEPSANFMVRFACGDLSSGSVIEAAVDGVELSDDYCDEVFCDGDVNNDGNVSVTDLLMIIADWGSNNPVSDVDGDGIVAVGDLLLAIGNWGSCDG